MSSPSGTRSRERETSSTTSSSVVAIEPREPVLPEGLTSAARVIGDALAPRDIDAAIFDAVEVAYAAAGYEDVGRPE